MRGGITQLTLLSLAECIPRLIPDCALSSIGDYYAIAYISLMSNTNILFTKLLINVIFIILNNINKTFLMSQKKRNLVTSDYQHSTGIILGMGSTTEKRHYLLTPELLCNASSHWLGPYPEWSPCLSVVDLALGQIQVKKSLFSINISCGSPRKKPLESSALYRDHYGYGLNQWEETLHGNSWRVAL